MKTTLKERILNRIDVNNLYLHFTEIEITLVFSLKRHVIRDIAAQQREKKRLREDIETINEDTSTPRVNGEWSKLKKTQLYKQLMN